MVSEPATTSLIYSGLLEVRGVDDELIVNQTNPHAGNRNVYKAIDIVSAAEAPVSPSTSVVFVIRRQTEATICVSDNNHPKKRTNRPVDQPGSQNPFGRFSFALEKPPSEFRQHIEFSIIHRQAESFRLPSVLIIAGCYKHHGVTERRALPICLLGELARFNQAGLFSADFTSHVVP